MEVRCCEMEKERRRKARADREERWYRYPGEQPAAGTIGGNALSLHHDFFNSLFFAKPNIRSFSWKTMSSVLTHLISLVLHFLVWRVGVFHWLDSCLISGKKVCVPIQITDLLNLCEQRSNKLSDNTSYLQYSSHNTLVRALTLSCVFRNSIKRR